LLTTGTSTAWPNYHQGFTTKAQRLEGLVAWCLRGEKLSAYFKGFTTKTQRHEGLVAWCLRGEKLSAYFSRSVLALRQPAEVVAGIAGEHIPQRSVAEPPRDDLAQHVAEVGRNLQVAGAVELLGVQ